MNLDTKTRHIEYEAIGSTFGDFFALNRAAQIGEQNLPQKSKLVFKIGARGFEPPAFRTRNGRATKLRYAPMG